MPSPILLAALCLSFHHRSGGADAAREIHSAFAKYIWKKFGHRGLGRALVHFVRGSDMQAFAEGEWQKALRNAMCW